MPYPATSAPTSNLTIFLYTSIQGMNKYISFAHVDLVSKSLTPARFQSEQTQVFTGLFRASYLTQRYT